MIDDCVTHISLLMKDEFLRFVIKELKNTAKESWKLKGEDFGQKLGEN